MISSVLVVYSSVSIGMKEKFASPLLTFNSSFKSPKLKIKVLKFEGIVRLMVRFSLIRCMRLNTTDPSGRLIFREERIGIMVGRPWMLSFTVAAVFQLKESLTFNSSIETGTSVLVSGKSRSLAQLVNNKIPARRKKRIFFIVFGFCKLIINSYAKLIKKPYYIDFVLYTFI